MSHAAVSKYTWEYILTLFPAQKVKMFIDVMCKLNKPDTDETNVYRSADVELWWCTVLWWTSGQWSSGLLCWSVLHQQQIKVVLWSAIRRAVDYTLLYRWPRQCTGVCVCACSARSPCRVADQHYADLSPNWGLRYWVLSYLLGVLIGSQGSWYGLSFTRGRLHAGAMQILT